MTALSVSSDKERIMSYRGKSQHRRTSRWIVAIGAAAVLVIAPSAHAAPTFIYANSASGTPNQRLYKIDATTGAVVTTCLMQKGNGRGIVVVGNLAYYTVADSNNVFRADINTCQDLGVAFSVSGVTGLSTMAYDGTNFWIGDYSGTNKAFYYSPTGTLLQTITLGSCTSFCDGLEFFNGQLISNRGDQVGPYDVYSTAGTLLTPSFLTANSLKPTGIAFDGTNFHVSDIYNQKLQVYDGTGAFLSTITITGMAAGADLIEDLSFDYAEVIPPAFDPCCPPWNATRLEELLEYRGSGGIADPFTLFFRPSAAFLQSPSSTVDPFANQMQLYINYVHSLNASIKEIVLQFWLTDAGTGATPVPTSPVLGNYYFIGWFNGAGGHPHGNVDFFTATESMQVNRWYRVNTYMYLNDFLTFFPPSCAGNFIDVRIQVQHDAFEHPASRGRADKRVLQIRMPGGRIVERSLSSVNE